MSDVRCKYVDNSGVAVLPTILLIGGLLTTISASLLFISYFFGQGSFGIKLSNEALAAAQAGISDAIIRVVRDKNYNTVNSSYSLAVGNRSAQVSVCAENRKTDFMLDPDPCDVVDNNLINKREITSIGSAFNKKRRLKAIINVNDDSGEIKTELVEEVAL